MSHAIVVPAFQGAIKWQTDAALRGCEKLGLNVKRIATSAGIDRQRSMIAQRFLDAGHDQIFWIDADISFDPADVVTMLEHPEPFVCGAYVQKLSGGRPVLCPDVAADERIVFGKGGGLIPVRSCGFGFVMTRAEVFAKIGEKLPLCADREGPFRPYFHCIVSEQAYLSEDLSFCQRAREAGVQLLCDTRPRLWHHGEYSYSLEDTQPRRVYDTIEVPAASMQEQ